MELINWKKKLTTTSGDLSLKDLCGVNGLVLYFYPKDMTPGCTTEACGVRDNYSEFTKLGWSVVGVSADSVQKHVKFQEKNNLNFVLISDDMHVLAEFFGVWVKKKLFAREYYGIQRSTFFINKDGIVINSWLQISPISHASNCIDFIRNLNE